MHLGENNNIGTFIMGRHKSWPKISHQRTFVATFKEMHKGEHPGTR